MIHVRRGWPRRPFVKPCNCSELPNEPAPGSPEADQEFTLSGSAGQVLITKVKLRLGCSGLLLSSRGNDEFFKWGPPCGLLDGFL